MKIRSFILATSVAVGIVFLGGSWWAISRGFDEAFSEHARNQADDVAALTFSAMYEIMSRGWTREEAERFLAGIHRNAADGESGRLKVMIFRAPAVVERYGEIDQPDPGRLARHTLDTGEEAESAELGVFRRTFPLKAETRCLACHDNAQVGEVLGAIEVRQPFEQVLWNVRSGFYLSALPSLLLGMLVAIGAVWWVSRRIERSVDEVERSLDSINSFSDLRQLSVNNDHHTFAEFHHMHGSIVALATKLRSIAVDKDILLFEIGLLEKFVITSEVIRDWRVYVGRLLEDINTVIEAHVLFSVFQIDDELFDIEIFWYVRPDDTARRQIEQSIREALHADERFGEPATLNIHHHAPESTRVLSPDEQDAMVLRIKSFFVDRPRIGSIVGIGVQSDALADHTHSLVLDSILSTLLNVVGSIKAIHKYTRDLEYYATRDPLTDLYNQRVFWELLGYEIGRSNRHEAKCTLLLLDLDNFKLINDHYGHATGDRFLQRFAEAVDNSLRGGDILARYGGDEFVIVLPETDMEQGYAIAQRVLAAAKSVALDATPGGEQIRGSVSIGLAVYPDHAADAKDLFLFADNMMYRAKAEGKERVSLPSTEDVMAVFRDVSEMGVAVLAAVNERRVIPYFQPILGLDGNRLAAVEVLSRLEVNGELMRADQFIEIAEKIGIIHRLDTIVIEAALAKIKDTDFDGYIFFNLSPRALVLAEFARTLRTVVKESGISPERIVFEITERDTVKNLSLLERFITDLKSEGFGLAIDDFGSGFSSFHYLRRFPFDFLKIEGDFIANMLHSERDRVFVQSITSLAKALNIRVVAEFVESAEVLEVLRELNIDFAQGYYIGRPERAVAISDAVRTS
ncbi:EAL domain-containing protein [Pseudothauera nasutitermitis]|uniref:EAL domain-containing protein n=1 Tax=Pseudothauera nasutitermitis TaxID=2565930 RepID=A0A4S4B5Q9_9RHOO|nr:bifunctional diguanylate cyclase/phosphodiesterase [Pseudothauera nasutitermitis]THF66307.1 EAL domain-containing protein [Pseudothauera nasutitermitis]